MPTLTCPKCGNEQKEEYPGNHTVIGFLCDGCGEEVFSGKNFCVFCDFGDKPCPTLHFKIKSNLLELIEEMEWGDSDKKKRKWKTNVLEL